MCDVRVWTYVNMSKSVKPLIFLCSDVNWDDYKCFEVKKTHARTYMTRCLQCMLQTKDNEKKNQNWFKAQHKLCIRMSTVVVCVLITSVLGTDKWNVWWCYCQYYFSSIFECSFLNIKTLIWTVSSHKPSLNLNSIHIEAPSIEITVKFEFQMKSFTKFCSEASQTFDIVTMSK